MKVLDYHDFTYKDMPLEERQRVNVGPLWINAVHCLLCDETVRSRNRHDMVSCKCGAVAIDGGSWYGRSIFKDRNNVEFIQEKFTYLAENEQ